ncbi:MAG: nuclear transport factor 2 family protein [Myxococcota bacterium]
MPVESLKGQVLRFFAAISSGDEETLCEMLAEDATWVIPRSAPAPFGGTHRGNRKIAGMMVASVGETFEPGSQTFDVLLMLEEGAVVIAEANIKARTPAGDVYDNLYVFIFEFEDGRVRELREHVDTIYAANFFAR